MRTYARCWRPGASLRLRVTGAKIVVKGLNKVLCSFNPSVAITEAAVSLEFICINAISEVMSKANVKNS
eukprot:14770555-Ditylum_brightwellii.AAC.1